MGRTSTQAYIRQLCCLGLPGPAIVPLLLKSIRPWFNAETSNMFLLSPAGIPQAIVTEHEIGHSATQLYMELVSNNAEEEAGLNYLNMLGNPGSLHDTLHLGNKFHNSDLYNLFFRPHDAHQVLTTAIGDGKSPPLGTLSLWRSGKKALTASERTRLQEILPYIIHALKLPAGDITELIQEGEQGLLLMDGSGHPHYMSDRGREIIATLQCANALDGNRLSATLGALVRRLQRNLKGQEGGVPALTVQTATGRFEFRASPLESMAEGGNSLTAVFVTHEIPQKLRMLERMKELPLSPRQAEMCLLLADGHSTSEIAQRMSISNHTATSYFRAIYDKVGVADRQSLLALLSEQNKER